MEACKHDWYDSSSHQFDDAKLAEEHLDLRDVYTAQPIHVDIETNLR